MGPYSITVLILLVDSPLIPCVFSVGSKNLQIAIIKFPISSSNLFPCLIFLTETSGAILDI